MKKVTRLTPRVLARLIAEERHKINVEREAHSSKSSDYKLLYEIKAILKLKREQKKRLQEIKKLQNVRKKLKKSLAKRL